MSGLDRWRNLSVGQVVTYYPRAGKPGHEVTVLGLRVHPFHGIIVRFRYRDGREREVSYAKFHEAPQ